MADKKPMSKKQRTTNANQPTQLMKGLAEALDAVLEPVSPDPPGPSARYLASKNRRK